MEEKNRIYFSTIDDIMDQLGFTVIKMKSVLIIDYHLG